LTRPVAPLDILLEVQGRDTTLDQLAHRRATLPARADLRAIDDRLADIDGHRARAEADRRALSERQARLESDIAAVARRIHEVEGRMYSGEVSASRELMAMSEEVESLNRRRRELEEMAFEAMAAGEPVDAELARVAAEREATEADAARVRAAIAEAEAEIDAEVATERDARAALVAKLPDDLTQRYERLRGRLGGIGAARLEHGSCTGCHLALPAVELDHIRRAPPEAIITCEQCGRILVR
ncbi:MAG TPA: C4-type zinc ribbon domain-containing protein, partial [Acidimicrobiales bacterium]|nr:C4-type zinc ribbon domain-containing protein [Acidimicrobiales bacterium]